MASSAWVWIENKKDALKNIIGKVDVMLTNDAEARQFFGTPNLIKAGRAFLDMGPKAVIIKKGEHGAILFTGDQCFVAPAYPLENLVDPTGAGDSFAGGVLGWLARTGRRDTGTIRQSLVCGAVMSSIAIEGFSPESLAGVGPGEIRNRVTALHRLVEFQLADDLPV